MKILMVVQAYPQISETYIKTEIDQLALEHDIEILALGIGNYPYRNRKPHIHLTPNNEPHILAYLKEFAPDIIHGHYLIVAPVLMRLSQKLGVPFTVRSHSFDVLGHSVEQLQAVAGFINNKQCLGMLAFPFLRKKLEASGIWPEKMVNCFPVINYDRFYDESPNGNAVMNMGATLPKKNMEEYLQLSKLLPERQFNLYALGYLADELKASNTRLQARVNFIPPIEPDDMLPHYKKHEWLVYTASSKVNTVGWPMSIAEAQAAGVGVCMQNIRPDLQDYIGDAGFLFDTVEEAAAIISQPFPQAQRARGFELAKRSDIGRHLPLLTDLWQR